MNTPTKPGYYWVQNDLSPVAGVPRWGMPQIVKVYDGALGLMIEKFGKRTSIVPITCAGFLWLGEVYPHDYATPEPEFDY